MNGHRDWAGPSEEHQPVTWVRGYPVYAAHFIVAVFVASMIATSLLMFGTTSHVLNWLVYDGAAVLRGQVWRIVTFGLVNAPSISFAIDMVFIVWFGREVERYIGRKAFLGLFAAVYLVTPLILTALAPWVTYSLAGKTGALAVFVAFATLYPGAPVFFNVLARWAALILVGIYTLMALAYHDVVLLISIWASCGTAFGMIRYHQGALTLPKLRLRPARKPHLRVLPDLPAKKTSAAAPKPSREDSTMAEVDALLDKIAQSGMASLTPKERAKLDAARADLVKRGVGRG